MFTHPLNNDELHPNGYGEMVPFEELTVLDIHYLAGHEGDEIDCDACAENHIESVADGSFVSDEWITHSKFVDGKWVGSEPGTITCKMCDYHQG